MVLWLPHQAGIGASVSDLYLSRTAAERQLRDPTTTKLRWRCQLLALLRDAEEHSLRGLGAGRWKFR